MTDSAPTNSINRESEVFGLIRLWRREIQCWASAKSEESDNRYSKR